MYAFLYGLPQMNPRSERGCQQTAAESPEKMRRNRLRLMHPIPFAVAAAVLAGMSCRPAHSIPSSATDVGSPSASATGAATYGGDRRPAVFPASWPHKAGRAAAFGTHAMVASDA